MELSVSLFSVHLFTHLLAFLYSVHAVSVTETDRERETESYRYNIGSRARHALLHCCMVAAVRWRASEC
jgi:hypothetical protein